ncbi:hypothetical protein SRABI76_02643 [Microbacterium oxydans]|uniref:hypothetical protein n=1 Tax=Microbacterium oxydans TaxID=82380 RepID=UPI001DC6C387|nr:hypothetical protein [Microbacterium oxydans]CAH0226512.1 hypothetical protein SRABI76_02643 [Microbacterium oxydans]
MNDLSPVAGTTDAITRRTLLTAAAWSAPVIAVAVATPLAAASVAAASLAPAVTRFADDGSYRDYRVDFTLAGAGLPADITITWTPSAENAWFIFDPSANLTFLSGDVSGQTTYSLLSGSTSFWLRAQAFDLPMGSVPPYTVQAIDVSTGAVIASVTVTFTGEEPIVAE